MNLVFILILEVYIMITLSVVMELTFLKLKAASLMVD